MFCLLSNINQNVRHTISFKKLDLRYPTFLCGHRYFGLRLRKKRRHKLDVKFATRTRISRSDKWRTCARYLRSFFTTRRSFCNRFCIHLFLLQARIIQWVAADVFKISNGNLYLGVFTLTFLSYPRSPYYQFLCLSNYP